MPNCYAKFSKEDQGYASGNLILNHKGKMEVKSFKTYSQIYSKFIKIRKNSNLYKFDLSKSNSKKTQFRGMIYLNRKLSNEPLLEIQLFSRIIKKKKKLNQKYSHLIQKIILDNSIEKSINTITIKDSKLTHQLNQNIPCYLKSEKPLSEIFKYLIKSLDRNLSNN